MPDSGRLKVVRRLIMGPSHYTVAPQLSCAEGNPQVWRDKTGKAFAFGYTVSGVNYLAFPGSAVYSFCDHDEDVVAFPESNTRPEIIEDLFWRSALPLVLQTQGVGALHASAILTPAGVVGFCAEAGRGKSTLAYGLYLRGFPIWTDDALAFDAQEEPVMATSLPFKVRMRPDPADYYQAGHLCKGSGCQLQRDFQQAPQDEAPVRAIVVLQRDCGVPSAVSLIRMEGAAALVQLLKHAYVFSLSRLEQRRSISQQYMDLAVKVPVFELRFPSGLEHLPLVLDRLKRFLNNELPP